MPREPCSNPSWGSVRRGKQSNYASAPRSRRRLLDAGDRSFTSCAQGLMYRSKDRFPGAAQTGPKGPE
jgi:hypothetical protein